MKINTTLLFSILLSLSCFAQNDITNTLGPNGSFIIKDGSTTFLTLSQSDGHITIPSTTSPSLGVIFKDTDRFIHNFKPTGAYGFNTFVGLNSGNFNMTATTVIESSNNTGLGVETLSKLTTGYRNTASGYRSLYSNTTGYSNTASGYASLSFNTTGNNKTAVGVHSLILNTIGAENTAVGGFSLNSNATGSENTAVGYNSLESNSSGFQNTAVGHHSLQNNLGNYNTALGFNAGSAVTSGANLTLIGIDANPSSPTVQNQITLGNSFVTSLRCNVQSISTLSDERDKKNIRDLTLGIDFLMKIKPRVFNWDRREWYPDNKSDGSKMKEDLTAGFIAQELDEVQTSENAEWLGLVLKDNPEKLEATTGNLLPIIVKAIQDLKKENDKLRAVYAELSAEIKRLKTDRYGADKVSLGEK